MSERSDVTIIDGSLDFSGGVNSYVVTTVQSQRNPHGLRRDQLAWLDNATVRGGGILQRTGWKNQGAVKCQLGLYQGAFMYHPLTDEAPYLIASIGGRIYKIDVDDPANAIDLSATGPGLVNSPTNEVSYFEQAEQFLIIQAGDYTTLPLFWDGTTLWRSVGLNTTINIVGVPGFSVPAIGFVSTVPLTANYTGTLNETVIIDGFHYIEIESYVHLYYTQPGGTSFGATVNAGTTIFDVSGNVVGTVLVSFIVPPDHVTIVVVFLTQPWTLGTPYTVVINGEGWQVFFAALAPPPPNTVYLVNLDDSRLGATIIANTVIQTIAELPAAGPMVYYMGRLWYAQGRIYSAGDIVGGPSGTLVPKHEDSVLKVTENPLAVGGDGFTVPAGSGNIRCLTFNANLNSTLGQGQLVIGTREEIFGLNVPVTRTNWIGAGNNNQPLQTILNLSNGCVNQRSVVSVNGDLFFQSLEPSVRSLLTALRYFDQWGNTPISINENRILAFNDRALMKYSGGIYFSNRLLQCVLPFACPVGVAHKAILPLNFDVVSTLETKLPPVWEGMYEGLNFLELAQGDFGGRQRAFSFAWSDVEQAIQLWELTDFAKFENGDNRVSWYIEFPAFTWGDEFALKKLVSAELWLDKLLGTVYFQMDYRPDGDPCWFPWTKWELCTAKNTCEDVHNAGASPYCADLRESFRQTITLPKPPTVCETVSGRPADTGYQFQCRLTIKGWCRVRGLLLHAVKVDQKLYGSMVC